MMIDGTGKGVTGQSLTASGRAKSLVLKGEGFTKAKAALWCLRHSREFLRGHDPMLLV